SSTAFFFLDGPATTLCYTLSLHDALPICSSSRQSRARSRCSCRRRPGGREANAPVVHGSGRADVRRIRAAWDPDGPLPAAARLRSEEHTSELQSPCNLVCRLLLEKKKNKP